jgi:hypothetical protein
MVISTHLPPPVMIDSTEVLKWVTHMLCWTWNLASNTASDSTMPSRVAAIQGIDSRVVDPPLRVADLSAGVALVPRTVELLGRSTELHDKVARQSNCESVVFRLKGMIYTLWYKICTSAQIRATRALLRWSAEDLARESTLGVTTIRRAELAGGATSMTTATTGPILLYVIPMREMFDSSCPPVAAPESWVKPKR